MPVRNRADVDVPQALAKRLSRNSKVVEAARVAALCRHVTVFSVLAPKTRAELLKASVAVDLAGRATLYRAGEQATGMYAVVSGQVKISVPLANGTHRVVNLLGPGDTFGLPATLLSRVHATTAQTVGRSIVLHVAKSSVVRLLKRDAVFSYHMLLELCARFQRATHERAHTSTQSGTKRILDLLLSQVPAGVRRRTTITLPAPKRVLASRLGLSAEHFSRILRELATQRVIAFNGSRVQIANPEKLRVRCDAAERSPAKSQLPAIARREPATSLKAVKRPARTRR